jgi:uncharacterized transporter YbjL
MSSIRRLVGGIVMGLLVLGYLASQVAALTGTAAEYAARVDQLPVQMLSLFLFLTALGLAVVPDKEESAQ